MLMVVGEGKEELPHFGGTFYLNSRKNIKAYNLKFVQVLFLSCFLCLLFT